MATYQAPLRFMRFLLHEVFNTEETLKKLNVMEDFNVELMDAILDEAANFSQQVLFPINQSGDEQGCNFNQGVVTTPDGFKEAYQKYLDGGWAVMGCSEEFGGQPLPKALHLMIEEIFYACNTSFGLYPNLTNTAIQLLETHASDALNNIYLSKMISGKWSGTMCLTESHAGSDLGLIKTRAVEQADNSYLISGTKIFISAGEHDLTENIVHLVLAKLPGAPEGSKGISLFLVPKFLPDDTNNPGERNAVVCGSIEHKMGIKGSATCVMNFDDAKGFLVGEINAGLKCMFTMMNSERLSVGMQGVGIAEVSLQSATAYALDRKQGRTKGSKEAAEPIIAHADIRRMLLSMMSMNGGCRALSAFAGNLHDRSCHHDDAEERKKSARMLAILTPVCKAFFTDMSFISCNHGVQIFGGHGYVKEWGMEQLVRDVRITQLYEGTNGIQSTDLLARKILADDGRGWEEFKTELCLMIKEAEQVNVLGKDCTRVRQAMTNLSSVTDSLLEDRKRNSGLVGSVATEYLHLFGTVTLGCLWLKMAAVSINTGEDDLFYKQIRSVCAFYCRHQMATVFTSVSRIMAGAQTIVSPGVDEFELTTLVN
ncbi:MAG: alkylation response protein AidB-like acyl-CoA dehydrogenase [Enterobacterales bacterium]|jgi:alkylation response protein AidB-like acyl-CoA dehydrogenase